MKLDPRLLRLSEHFVLSDFLGNNSVYTQGIPNDFSCSPNDLRLDNGAALCQEALEPILTSYGPMSISYGAIGPRLSEQIVKYQDPLKPSHHLWNLGAAADICVHRWVTGEFPTIMDLYVPLSAMGSPIALAHAIDYLDIPYSRLITYSESPYLCLAVSDQEVVRGQPRKAFYENRYTGRAKAKPDYKQYSTSQAKQRALAQLQDAGLEHPWEGGGFPSYHGGGTRQYQHRRVSKYTMMSDWLFDLKSITEGHRNVPSLNKPEVLDAFAAAGTVYDWILDTMTIERASIVAGYVSHISPASQSHNDWRQPTIMFDLMLPERMNVENWVRDLNGEAPRHGAQFTISNEGFLSVALNVGIVLDHWNPA